MYVSNLMQQKCWGKDHKYYVKNATIPSIILWSVGLPIAGLWLLLRNQKSIERIEKDSVSEQDQWKIERTKWRYGFIFSGFRQKCFYWEIVICFRKVALIISGILLHMASSEIQALIMLFIMTISLCLHLKCQPYYSPIHNLLETYSHYVILVTLYTGLIYLTARHYSYLSDHGHIGAHWFFFTAILLPNLLFLMHWLYHLHQLFLQSSSLRKTHPFLFRLLAFGCNTR